MINPLDLSSLALARKAAGLSQMELAEAAGATQKAIWSIEKGKRDPRASTWIKIVKVVQEALEAKNG